MASYDVLRHVTIGQYLPTGSPIHRLDPRAKLLALLALTVAVVLATSYASNIALLLFVLGLIRLSRIAIRYILSSVVPALPIIIVLALFQLLFYTAASSEDGSVVLVSWGPILISTSSVQLVIVSLFRFLNLLFLTSLLTNTTTHSALTNGVESLLRPLDAIGLPGHEIALVGAIALRFLPILGEELESIGQAQDSRRIKQQNTGRLRLIGNAQRLAKLVVPLFVDAFRRADEMALAMQARCYRGGHGRTHLVQLHMGTAGYIALSVSLAVVFAIIYLQGAPLP